ncbi:MAG TPA: potassium transporter Kup [Steroidobacteraceae bacterium]|jgi:KUP system potassium uptake protein|nr:potassium transporter Kup [Steroidobacteraceae bacterium]
MHARSPAAAVADSRSDANVKLVLTALGVVFGDIGTSPLYAFRECLNPEHGIAVTQQNIIGILSLILWSLVLIISIKYVAIVLRADNRGEGGVLALSTLVSSASSNWRVWGPVSAFGVFGAALFFGDGFITPAISVLSAMEGLAVATPRLEHFVLPGAMIILTALFLVQRRGTGAMGRMFGPVTLVWFVTLALLGTRWIITRPDVVFAINPLYAVQFFTNNGWAGFVTLASVFLAVTGGEALYADMGHFGRAPIRRGWFVIVLPALVLNYFGQGALLLENPSAISNPFYLMAPGWLLPILIVLATAATVIASQAVISGVFSITRQALNLGYLPRLRVAHSSEEEIGQVYVPTLNWLLFAGTMTLIVVFQSSSALAGAYGIAISSTMLIDSILVIMLLRVRPQEPRRRLVMGVLGFIALIEFAFFLSNSLKFDDGGWLPIAVAILAYVLMTTWQEGRRTLNWLVAKEQMPVRDFLALIEREPPVRVAGTAVYLASEAGGMPRALLNNLRFNRVLHQRNVLLTFVRPEMPFVSPETRVEIQNLGEGLCRVIARYGFMESPNVVAALRSAEEAGVPYEPEQTVYVVGRENPVFAVGSGMPLWRKRLFAFMGRNSQLAAIHFGVPSHRLLEVSSQVRL